MGWLRLVGALKVQVSFAKEPYKRDDILQKRPIILRRLLIVATPYKWMRHFTYDQIHSNFRHVGCYLIWRSHFTRMHESGHTYEWGMSHVWMCHVTLMNDSCHTYECVISHIWMSHRGHKGTREHVTYEWVISHIGMSHVTHINESCRT